MRVVCIGGGPGGLYLSRLLKRALPEAEVEVFERNAPDDTFGFGVVFSDASLSQIEVDDPETYERITANFAHWDDIDTFFKGEVRRSSGHGFSGLSRRRLLSVLAEGCEQVGVKLHFNSPLSAEQVEALRQEADLVVACDGVNSSTRERYAEQLQPRYEAGATRFTWLGTTKRFPAFTFYFKRDTHGLWRVHAYNYEDGLSTFIVETTEQAWQSAGLEKASEEETARFCEALFAEELEGHPLLINRSIWRRFPMVSLKRWSHENLVLLGDAAHSAHFSIGSGTKLAVEGAAALAQELIATPEDVRGALERYEATRRPAVESLQRAALVSQRWFEDTERYFDHLDADTFNVSMLTRSLRVTHSDLRERDPALVRALDERFERLAFERAGLPLPPHRTSKPEGSEPTPPMFTPYKARGLTLSNRVALSPMCQYKAREGLINAWHTAHYGARAVGGVGLLITEMTAISESGRITKGCAGLYTDEHEVAWADLLSWLHQDTEAKVCLQLGHAGRKAATRLMWEGMDQPLSEDESWPICSASPLPYYPHSQRPTALTREQMDAIKADYVRCAERALRAGFDMLELHCAHGYLLASFISPLTNKRDDEYGGSVEGRARFPLEVFEAVRAVWPAERPMSVRLSCTDWEEGGLSGEDFLATARLFMEAGCDLLNTSTGQTTSTGRPVFGRLFQAPYSERARLELGAATMVAGGVSSYGDVNSLLIAGRADLCLIGRAHLFDPYWTRHAAYEQGYPLAWPQPYGVVGGRYRPRMEWSGEGDVKD